MARMQLELFGERSISVDVSVPEKNTSCVRNEFPVLWLLHDSGGNHSDWFRYTNIELYSNQNGMIVICPDNEDLDGIFGQNLREYLYALLPAKKESAFHYIAGVGAGAGRAIKAAMANPGMFTAVIALYGEIQELPQEDCESGQRVIAAGDRDYMQWLARKGFRTEEVFLDEYNKFALDSYAQYLSKMIASEMRDQTEIREEKV